MAIGVADGDSIGDSAGVDKLEGTDTVPTSFGLPDGVGEGEGVAVETSTAGVVGVSVGVGVEMGVSVAVGGCANNRAAVKNAARPSPPTISCSFRITEKERWDLDARRLKRGFNQC